MTEWVQHLKDLLHKIEELPISSVDQPTKTGPQILILVLQAIDWIICARNETESSTAGYPVVSESRNEETSESEPDEDDFALAMVKMARELFGCDVTDLVGIDAEFTTCETDMSEWDKPASELEENDADKSEDDEELVSESEPVPVVTMSEASDCIHKLREIALHIGNKDMFKCVMDFDNLFVDMRVAKASKEKKVKDFFS